MYKLIFTLLGVFGALSLIQAQELSHRQGELLVRFDQNADVENTIRTISRDAGNALKPVREISEPLNIWLCSFRHDRISEDNMLEQARSNGGVQTAQFNHLIDLRQTLPDDPLFENQWQWLNMGFGGVDDADVDADLAWDLTTGGVTEGGDSIVVAVIDDGITFDHPDLDDNLWINHNEVPDNGVDDDDNGYVDDYHGWNIRDSTDDVGNGGHGVNVSGMIAAEGNNGIGITGINWKSKIMSITRSDLDEAKVIESYTYALIQRQLYDSTDGEKGAFVVATNSSWGIDGGNPEEAPLWCAFYDTLGVNGILSCGATANRDYDIGVEGDLPTGCTSEYLLSVTATNINDERTFAAFGEVDVDLGAPGEDVFTTSPENDYGTTSGTSYASPLTAGVIALLYSADCSRLTDLVDSDPREAARFVRDAIFKTVDETPQLLEETRYGGRINAHRALRYLLAQCGPCPAPVEIEIQNIIDTSATVQWSAMDTVERVMLQYRPLGDSLWNETTTDTMPIILNDLSACTNYELRLKSECMDTSSIFSFPVEFKTDGCCESPMEIEQQDSDFGTAMISWEEVLAAETYIYRYRKNAADSFIAEETMDTVAFIPGLQPCSIYDFQVATVCDTGRAPFRSVQISVPDCEACSEMDYCRAFGQTTEDEWINSVSFDLQSFTSGPNMGYLNRTGNVSFSFEQGQSGNVLVDVEYANIPFAEFHRIYLDTNQDGNFVDDEIIAESSEGIEGDFEGDYSIPQTTLPGITRMRVIIKYDDGSNLPPTACDSFEFGEVEDYCVRITNPCKEVDSLMVRDTMKESFEVFWNAVDTSIAYNIRYRDTSGDGEWTYKSALDTFLMITGLEKCTDYQVQVRTVCPSDTTQYRADTIFRTDCETAIAGPPDPLSGFEVFPNPVKNDFTLQFEAEESLRTQVKLFSTDGQLIEHLGRDLVRGPSTLHIDALDGRHSGVYLLVIDTPYKRYTEKVVKM